MLAREVGSIELDDDSHDQPESQAVEQRGKDFDPMKAVRALVGRRPLRKTKCEKAERHRANVRKHMAGVREQRQTVGQKARYKLGEKIEAADGQSPSQPPCFGVSCHGPGNSPTSVTHHRSSAQVLR